MRRDVSIRPPNESLPRPPTHCSINPPAKSRCLFWHCYVQPKQGIPLSDQWRRWRRRVFAALPVSAICLLLLKAVQTHFHPSPLAATQPRDLLAAVSCLAKRRQSEVVILSFSEGQVVCFFWGTRGSVFFFLSLSLLKLGFDEISFNWMLNCRCSLG